MATNPNPADPVNQLAPKPPGQPAHDDHDTSGPPAPEVIARGYEADVYDTKTVLSVPALVIFFFVAAFGITTVLFMVLSKPPAQPHANPQAKARNAVDVNTRLGRIGRGKEVDQPRLEPLRERTGDARAITRPEVTEKGANSPELHPEDLIPTEKSYPELFGSDKGRVGLDKTLSLDDAALKALFKSSGPALSEDASVHGVTASNAGRGAGPALAVSPKLPEPKAAPKKNEPAPKEAPKKEAPKKEAPKGATPPKDTKGGKQ